MAPLPTIAPSGNKRKAVPDGNAVPHTKRRRAAVSNTDSELDRQIEEIELSICEISSTDDERHSLMTKLISLFETENPNLDINVKVAISMCRVFSRMMAAELFSWSRQPEKEGSISWQIEAYQRYQSAIQECLTHGRASTSEIMLKINMRMLKEESLYCPDNVLLSKSFTGLISAIIHAQEGDEARKFFIEEYMQQYQDCCYYSLEAIGKTISTSNDRSTLANVVSFMSSLGNPPTTADDVADHYAPSRSATKKRNITPTSIKRQAESVWRGLLASKELYMGLRKTLLRQCTSTMLPWMSRPESLMDLLTDSYNLGGSISLLALSGLFHLINTKNLDYPSFYPKLYSLLDPDLLHSKHRSRFLRLLNTFLSSTHLPASLIASFIKRLARLSLFAPPAAIVAIIPYIYNLLKEHPTCTFMIHRPPYPPYSSTTENLGYDLFDMSEPDPQFTHAIDSSLWELETLQSHYHPNVASLARIISEQFTKQQYNLEDFLDHSYASMVESELGKETKRAPVVEWKIPKRIFTKPPKDAGQEEVDSMSLIQKLWDFS